MTRSFLWGIDRSISSKKMTAASTVPPASLYRLEEEIESPKYIRTMVFVSAVGNSCQIYVVENDDLSMIFMFWKFLPEPRGVDLLDSDAGRCQWFILIVVNAKPVMWYLHGLDCFAEPPVWR